MAEQVLRRSLFGKGEDMRKNRKSNNYSLQNEINRILSNPWSIAFACVLVCCGVFLLCNFLFFTVMDVKGLFTRELWFTDVSLLRNFYRLELSNRRYYTALGILMTLAAIRTAFNLYNSFSPLQLQGQKGSRRWTTLPELQAQYRAIPESGSFPGKGGIIISQYGNKLFIDDSAVNNLIIGTTRSGKGELIIIPSIDIYSRAKMQSSLIINDPKGEHTASGYDTLKKRGYDVYILNLIDLKSSMSFNPLQIIVEDYLNGDVDGAQLQARTFSSMLFYDPTAKDKVWQNWSISLTNALILAHVIDCCESGEVEKISLYSVARMLATYSTMQATPTRTALDIFFLSRPENDIARLQYATVLAADVRTKGNIYANTLSKLGQFTYSDVARLTARNDLDMLDIGFGEKPVAVFLCTPDYDPSLHFLASLFIKQMYYRLAKQASRSPGNKCRREVVVELDEAGNMPPIPDFASMITVSLGRNIRFDIVVQAYSQLDKLYGRDDARTIVSNCGNQIYLLTTDTDTAKHFSNLIGDETISSVTRSGKGLFSLSKSRNEQPDGRPLLTAGELMELTPGETVVVRVIKRLDNKGRKVAPNPIFNTGDTTLQYRYESPYLSRAFDTSKALAGCPVDCGHNNIDLESIVYQPFSAGQEQGEQAEAFTEDFPLSTLLSKQQQATLASFAPDIELDMELSRDEMLEVFHNLYSGEGIDQNRYQAALRLLNSIKSHEVKP